MATRPSVRIGTRALRRARALDRFERRGNFRMKALPRRAQRVYDAATARRPAIIAALLSVEHEHFVVVVHLLRREADRELRLELRVRRPDAERLGDQTEALRDAVV